MADDDTLEADRLLYRHHLWRLLRQGSPHVDPDGALLRASDDFDASLLCALSRHGRRQGVIRLSYDEAAQLAAMTGAPRFFDVRERWTVWGIPVEVLDG